MKPRARCCCARKCFDIMWGAAVSNPPHYHYVPGPKSAGPQRGPSGPVLSGPAVRHLRPQSSYSLPHGTNGPGRWGWSGNQASSFDRRQLKVPPQPARPAPSRPSQSRNTASYVSKEKVCHSKIHEPLPSYKTAQLYNISHNL